MVLTAQVSVREKRGKGRRGSLVPELPQKIPHLSSELGFMMYLKRPLELMGAQEQAGPSKVLLPTLTGV